MYSLSTRDMRKNIPLNRKRNVSWSLKSYFYMFIQLKNVFIVKRNKYIPLALLKNVDVNPWKGEEKIHWSGEVCLSNYLLTFHYGGKTDILERLGAQFYGANFKNQTSSEQNSDFSSLVYWYWTKAEYWWISALINKYHILIFF